MTLDFFSIFIFSMSLTLTERIHPVKQYCYDGKMFQAVDKPLDTVINNILCPDQKEIALCMLQVCNTLQYWHTQLSQF